MNDSPGDLQVLTARVDQLEKRVSALEHPVSSGALTEAARSPEPASNAPSALETASIFPIIGRAMLGIAGAYVLRALAEAGTTSKLPISVIAVVYAFTWLIGSDRASSRIARNVYAATSALILAPMLWENTLAFHVFTPIITAGVLAAFLTLAATLELRSQETRTIGIAQTVAALVAAALAFATHEVLPFVATLLIAVFIIEFARTRDLPQPAGPLIVLITDATLWGVTFIYAGPPDTRVNYHDLTAVSLIPAPSLLFLLNGGAASIRVLARNCTITILEIIQFVIAFVLVAVAVSYFAPLHGPVLLGLSSLILSAAAYFIAFRYLRCRTERRSFRIFSFWGAALLIAGSLWALPYSVAAVLLAIAAVAAIYLANHTEPEVFQFHGTLFLLTAVFLARVPGYVYDCVAGTPPHSPSWDILAIAICAALAMAISTPKRDGVWKQTLYLLPQLIAICVLTALLVHGVLAATAAVTALGPQHIAVLRTLVISSAALAVAFGGSRLGRTALTYVSYLALAVLAVKLFFEDLRHGHMEFTAASIGLFAIALMTTPKLVRIGARRRTHASDASPRTSALIPH